MSDREKELVERWRAERPMYEKWGEVVADTLRTTLAKAIHPMEIDLFLRMPINWRTKQEKSLLDKALYRGKPYANPYDEIEDKVGLRIIVLFSDEIRIVERAITGCPLWAAAKARDFEEERALKPYEFDYQSLHYIVRSNAGIKAGDTDIIGGTPCEIQVRTLLQHAYSELTHDTIYKPSVQADPQVKRAAAKSMALMEATDDYFLTVRDRLQLAAAPGIAVTEAVRSQYPTFTGLDPQPSALDTLIVDHFKQFGHQDFAAQLMEFLDEKAFLADRIRERAPGDLLYRQPGILLVYWAINRNPRGAAAADGPLSDDELRPLYSDLGVRYPEN